MKRVYRITVLSTLLVIIVSLGVWSFMSRTQDKKQIKVGFIYIGDAATAYTYNFISAMSEVAQNYEEQVLVIPKYNIHEENGRDALQDLVDEGCDLIFATSYGYGQTTKEFAKMYPDIQFCQATCDNANTEPVLENYHTFMGEIYQGRYICGVVAGMKLKELIDSGAITDKEAKIGYIAAYPYAEVISGYTAFLLGARSVVPETVMEVIYTDTWGNYSVEESAAKKLIANGCIIISQHSDTKGVAEACEKTDKSANVYHVGYNQKMSDVAPTTNLTGCRINWEPYILSAVGAVLEDKKIEDVVEGNVHGNDIGAGFDKGWVEMLKVNEIAAAPGTAEKVAELISQFKSSKMQVFYGDYIGVNPFDETDVCDLKNGYMENEDASAPGFHYVLKDVITIIE